MRFLSPSNRNTIDHDREVGQGNALEIDTPIKWEIEQTPEALYVRINEVSVLFSQGKYTKALAIQRLLDLLYDINLSKDSVFEIQAKSRYYLLIFNYIHRIRSEKFKFPYLMKRKIQAADQMMYINGIDFSGMSLPGLRVANALFKNCIFPGSILLGLRTSNCYFEECSFAGANLKEFSGNSSHFIQCRFESADLSNSELTGSSFEGGVFNNGNFSSAQLVNSSFTGCDFSEIVSSRGQFPLRVNECNFLACSFREADLRSADFRNTKMVGCDTLDAKKENSKGLT